MKTVPSTKRLRLNKYAVENSARELHKPNSAIMDLTNKFINDLFELQYNLEKNESEKAKRNDSFTFHYVLADALAYSDYAKIDNASNQRELIGMSTIEVQLVKEMFKQKMRGIGSDLIYVIQNHKKQERYNDYFVNNLNFEFEAYKSKEFNIDCYLKKDAPKGEPYKTVKKQRITVSFETHNNKSGNGQKVVVNFINNDFDSASIFTPKNELILTIDSREEPTIQHFKYVADINSFLGIIDQVIFGIKNPE